MVPFPDNGALLSLSFSAWTLPNAKHNGFSLHHRFQALFYVRLFPPPTMHIHRTLKTASHCILPVALSLYPAVAKETFIWRVDYQQELVHEDVNILQNIGADQSAKRGHAAKYIDLACDTVKSAHLNVYLSHHLVVLLTYDIKSTYSSSHHHHKPSNLPQLRNAFRRSSSRLKYTSTNNYKSH